MRGSNNWLYELMTSRRLGRHDQGVIIGFITLESTNSCSINFVFYF
ncbi:unnamed protein product [Brassica rapa subsp. trilocularis]